MERFSCACCMNVISFFLIETRLMTKRWMVQKKKFDDVVAQVLYNRGITTAAEQKKFLAPNYERDLGDPFLMKGMKKAVARVKKALKNKEKIGIFGDYDVDGICGSIVLHEFFEKVGVTPSFETYLPDRATQGYGLNRHGVSHFKEQGVTLMITVDCGITDHKEIKWAQEHGIDVIVTDHHEVSQGLPEAYAIVNPKQKGDTYPFSGLAGAGVAFKLAQALRQRVNHERISEAWEKWLLDLVAFATVADQMPLIGENRALVKYGLMVFSKTRRRGLRELINVAGLDPAHITTEDILFGLAPRVNAASRIDHAQKAFKLLTTQNPIEARALAKEIDAANKTRQRLVAQACKDIQERIEKNIKQIQKDKVIFAGSRNFAPGACGLVANKILDRYGYPAFIYSIGPDCVKGSVRSAAPFSVVDAMGAGSKYLLDWGGHHQAGGFSLEEKNLAFFHKALRAYATSRAGKKIASSLYIDARLTGDQATLDVWDKLQELAPFGKGNPEPVFMFQKTSIYAARKVGKGQDHYKLTLRKDGQFFEAIYFNGVNDHQELAAGGGRQIDAAFYLKKSIWGVRTRPELHIIDLKDAD